MHDTAATKKAQSRSRLRRKALAAAAAPASDECETEVALEPFDQEALPAPANDAFAAARDEHEAPPFDPPDESDEILGGEPECGDDALLLTEAPAVGDDGELLLTEEAGVDEACEFAAALEEELLLEAEAVAEARAEAPATEIEDEAIAPLSADNVVDESAASDADAEHAAVEEDFAEAAAQEDDELPPFDPPDEEEGGFREARLEDTDARPVIAGALYDEEEPQDAAHRPGMARPARPEPHLTDEPTPPVSIVACWERAEVGEMLEALAGDGRLARADFYLERCGLAGALANCAKHGAPDLLILDTAARQAEMLAGLDRLARLTGDTKVIVIGAVNDIGLLRELAGRGISEYIVPPTSAEHVARTICGFFAERDKSQVIAVIGARGGVGASTIAHNVAWSIAGRQDVATALVDLDLSFGTSRLGFREDPLYSIADILKDERIEDALERVATRKSDRLQVLTAPATPACEVELDGNAVQTVIAGMRRISRAIVLDLPHVWNEGVRQALASADDVLVVSSPDLASLRNTDNLLKHLKAARDKVCEPLVVLSMVGVPKRPEITLKDFSEAIGAAPVMSVAFDPPLFGACAEKGEMVGEAAPRSKTALAFDALATALTGRQPVERRRKRSKRTLTSPEQKAAAPAPEARRFEQASKTGPQDDPAVQLVGETTVSPAPASSPELTHVQAASAQHAPAGAAAAALTPTPYELEMARTQAASRELASVESARGPAPLELTVEAWAPGEAANDEASVATQRQNETGLELVEELGSNADAHKSARIYRFSADRAQRLMPPRRKSSGLIRTAAGLIAAVGLLAWYVEQQRQTAEAAEPQPPRASVRMPLQRPAPAVDVSAQYQRALQQIETGQAGEGAALLRQLAESGFVLAQYRLAKAYEKGEGVAADLALARQWTERAAAGGNRQAMHDLGVYYSRGEGGARDDGAAFRWFRQGADFDVADSQYNLGILYRQGRGVRRDPAEALFWFMLAARHGDTGAAAHAAALEAELNGMQVEQARARMAAFEPRPANVLANGVLAQGPAPAGAAALAPRSGQ